MYNWDSSNHMKDYEEIISNIIPGEDLCLRNLGYTFDDMINLLQECN